MVTILTSRRFLIAILIAIAGALLAAQISGYWGRSIAMVITTILAIIIILDESVNAMHKHRDGENNILYQSIDEHPGFQEFTNMITHPLLIISNNRVVTANLSAIQLLGTPLIGQNIAGAFRHSAIIEQLAKDNIDSDKNISISGLGQRSQKWEMNVRDFGTHYRLVQLFDKSANHAVEKMRVDFVANASHELLTPLASIRGFIETLNDEAASNDTELRKKFLNIISDESERMELLIRDLMSLSRIEAGTFADTASNIIFTNVAEQAVNSLIKGSNKRGKDIIFKYEDDMPRISGDEAQLRQMVINIIANSMKYAEKDTPINVSIEKTKSASMLKFSVKDHGNGIDPLHIPRLTERFYRIDSGRSKALGGTGLGLSLVKHIVQRHRGHMDISSKKGDGTLITILLPIAAIDQENINHKARARRSSKPIT